MKASHGDRLPEQLQAAAGRALTTSNTMASTDARKQDDGRIWLPNKTPRLQLITGFAVSSAAEHTLSKSDNNQRPALSGDPAGRPGISFLTENAAGIHRRRTTCREVRREYTDSEHARRCQDERSGVGGRDAEQEAREQPRHE